MTGRVSRRQIEQLDRISNEEQIDRTSALRKVLDIGIKEYMKRRAVEDYRRGKISIGKAAEVAGISMAELYKVLSDEGVPIRIDTANLKESLRSDVSRC
ncbi:MAG: UPF0175 family protein [Nitrososphaerales archaeon]